MRNDQIFTPDIIVTKMLDKLGYRGEAIRTKTIFEPSFGGGAFLVQIVNRILAYADQHKLSEKETVDILNNVYGIEIDEKWYNHTVGVLTDILRTRGIEYDWPNLILGDATHMLYNNKFDLCCANPPFCRVHDLNPQERKHIERNFKFGTGNTDLYVIFFELAMNALKHDGKMCFITPNSFLKNSSQKQFREYLSNHSLIKEIEDYAHVKVFGKIATYAAITTIVMEGCEKMQYIMMDDFINVGWVTSFKPNQLGGGPWTFVNKSDEAFLQRIASRKTKLGDLCAVQYGLATNADNVYLVDKDSDLEPEMLRPAVKGSTLDVDKLIIFPYTFNKETKRYALIDETTLRERFPKTYAHLLKNKEKLMSRDMEKDAVWYQYGRSQGIQNSRHQKIALKHVVSKEDALCAIRLLDVNTLVYSGMFIVINNDEDVLRVMSAITSSEFCKYVKLVGKNMAGGYKNFNTTAVKNFGIANGKKEEKD